MDFECTASTIISFGNSMKRVIDIGIGLEPMNVDFLSKQS
jgi:hypothetical protein